jgi:hypothetical protein
VDSAQGSESHIIILSGVRDNAAKEVGFLKSDTGVKRICVATSRAKEALIVVGGGTLQAVHSMHALWGLQEPPLTQLTVLKCAGDILRRFHAVQASQREMALVKDLML